MTVMTRFAPSPTGDLHLGHAYAAIYAHDLGACRGGTFVVRIEDIDAGRCRDEFVGRNLDDLAWLGLSWETPVVRQSDRMELYRAALLRLDKMGVTYPCFCTRKEILDEIAAAQAAPHPTSGRSPDVVSTVSTNIYPGTCRNMDDRERRRRIKSGCAYAIRLDHARALERTGPVRWTDRRQGDQQVDLKQLGDVVVARKDLATSYHLSVVVDDAAQGITEVTRGCDLFDVTHVHRVLYDLLDLPIPVWHHHDVCVDANGRRLSKRAGDTTLRSLRARGLSATQVRVMAENSLAPGEGDHHPL